MKVFITGGGGFLARHIIQQLRANNHDVTSYQRGNYPFLNEWGVKSVQGDLLDSKALTLAMHNHDVVMHVAAKAGVWGDKDSYYQTNVIGTENVLNACKNTGINKLIYTSTPSVVFNGEDEIGIDEQTPYCQHPYNAYQATKIIAEQNVLAANSLQLATLALRPHLLWGVGDPHLVARIINRAKQYRLRLVKSENTKVDACYVDNAAIAHVNAMQALLDNNSCAGKAYFIANDEPIVLNDLINQILTAAKLPTVTPTVPVWAAYVAGQILEHGYKLCRIKNEPVITRFVAKQLSVSHWFNLGAAKRELNYVPQVTTAEGLRRLSAHFSEEDARI